MKCTRLHPWPLKTKQKIPYRLLPCHEAPIQPVDAWDHNISFKNVMLPDKPFKSPSYVTREIPHSQPEWGIKLHTHLKSITGTQTAAVAPLQWKDQLCVAWRDELGKLCSIKISKQYAYVKWVLRHKDKMAFVNTQISKAQCFNAACLKGHTACRNNAEIYFS